jgi:hypothetical protein
MCVFVKRSRDEEYEDFVAGLARQPAPRGYKLYMWVSVTGLERRVAES